MLRKQKPPSMGLIYLPTFSWIFMVNVTWILWNLFTLRETNSHFAPENKPVPWFLVPPVSGWILLPGARQKSDAALLRMGIGALFISSCRHLLRTNSFTGHLKSEFSPPKKKGPQQNQKGKKNGQRIDRSLPM